MLGRIRGLFVETESVKEMKQLLSLAEEQILTRQRRINDLRSQLDALSERHERTQQTNAQLEVQTERLLTNGVFAEVPIRQTKAGSSLAVYYSDGTFAGFFEAAESNRYTVITGRDEHGIFASRQPRRTP